MEKKEVKDYLEKMTVLGKTIITEIGQLQSVKKAKKNNTIILPDSPGEAMSKDAYSLEEIQQICTVKVLKVGPEVRPEIKPGCELYLNPEFMSSFGRFFINGDQVHRIFDNDQIIIGIVG